MSAHPSERQRRLDILRRELASIRTRAHAALMTARALDEAYAADDEDPRWRQAVRSRAREARARWRQLVARGHQVETTLDQIAASLAKRPPTSQRERVAQ